MRRSNRIPAVVLSSLIAVLILAGCGTTQNNLATQQLLESDAIDAAIARVDFSPLSGHKVYFDAAYIQDYKGIGFVNSNYVVSGLRQQILGAGCFLQESKDQAEYIVEGRIGTLGSDQHDVVYGLPKNNALNTVATAVPNSPALPAIPELALAKKASSQGAAKLALFAYDRESRKPVWQSGLSIARSTSRDTWVLGAGPFQRGTIHRDRIRFAGDRLNWRIWKRLDGPYRGPEFAAYESGGIYLSPDIAADETKMAGEPDRGAPELLTQKPDAKPIDAAPQPAIQQVAHEEVVDETVPTAHDQPPPAAMGPPPIDVTGPPPFPGP
ncbi:MAG: hypothetical protein KDA75_02585 [Planctomycetaceae bacterium]|nr:hypothetical protein [Planctomycetaceae bacterium]